MYLQDLQQCPECVKDANLLNFLSGNEMTCDRNKELQIEPN